MVDLEGLPAAERLRRGLADLRSSRRTCEALWLAAAAGRLRALGLPIPAAERLPPEPELGLYELLRREADDPYYRYNAWRRELDSLIAALEARVGRERREGSAASEG